MRRFALRPAACVPFARSARRAPGAADTWPRSFPRCAETALRGSSTSAATPPLSSRATGTAWTVPLPTVVQLLQHATHVTAAERGCDAAATLAAITAEYRGGGPEPAGGDALDWCAAEAAAQVPMLARAARSGQATRVDALEAASAFLAHIGTHRADSATSDSRLASCVDSLLSCAADAGGDAGAAHDTTALIDCATAVYAWQPFEAIVAGAPTGSLAGSTAAGPWMCEPRWGAAAIRSPSVAWLLQEVNRTADLAHLPLSVLVACIEASIATLLWVDAVGREARVAAVEADPEVLRRTGAELIRRCTSQLMLVASASQAATVTDALRLLRALCAWTLNGGVGCDPGAGGDGISGGGGGASAPPPRRSGCPSDLLITLPASILAHVPPTVASAFRPAAAPAPASWARRLFSPRDTAASVEAAFNTVLLRLVVAPVFGPTAASNGRPLDAACAAAGAAIAAPGSRWARRLLEQAATTLPPGHGDIVLRAAVRLLADGAGADSARLAATVATRTLAALVREARERDRALDAAGAPLEPPTALLEAAVLCLQGATRVAWGLLGLRRGSGSRAIDHRRLLDAMSAAARGGPLPEIVELGATASSLLGRALSAVDAADGPEGAVTTALLRQLVAWAEFAPLLAAASVASGLTVPRQTLLSAARGVGSVGRRLHEGAAAGNDALVSAIASAHPTTIRVLAVSAVDAVATMEAAAQGQPGPVSASEAAMLLQHLQGLVDGLALAVDTWTR